MSEQWTPKADDFRQVWAAFNGYGGLVARPHSVSMDEGYAEFDRWIEHERAVARREGQAEANAALAERVADYADATYDLIDSPNGARLAFEYIVAMIRGEVDR